MPERPDFEATGGRLSGEDMRLYMEHYTDSFLSKNIRYNVEVINIRRISPDTSQTDTPRWVVTISNIIGDTKKLIINRRFLYDTPSYENKSNN